MMDTKFTYSILLLLFMCIHGRGATGMHGHGNNPSSDIHPLATLLFRLNDLKIGNKKPLYFPNLDPYPKVIPREEADSIPFSYKDLPRLLQLFSVPEGSPLANAMEDALRTCEAEPIQGKAKYCATSLESLLDFVSTVFGPGNNFQVLMSTHLTNSRIDLQEYTILKFEQILNSKIVSCHTMSYPYTIFYCHSPPDHTQVFKVFLAGDNGDMIDATAVCHFDTSQWNSSHMAFKMLGVKPGSSEVCHFFPEDHMVWVSK